MAYSEDITENQLMVQGIEDEDNDNSVVKLMREKMEQLGIFNGDCVLLKGKKERNTVCVAFSDRHCPPNCIKMNLDIRINLRVLLGDAVFVFPLRHIDYGKSVRVLPVDDTIEGKTCNLFSEYLQPYFGGNKTAYRPLHEGDIFKVGGPQGIVEFKVIATDPKPFCVVAPETIVYFQGVPIERNEINGEMNMIGYDSFGGYKKELMAIREVIDLSLKHSSIFHNVGLQPPRGILLYGPPGSGKTLIAKAINNECGINFIDIDCRKLKNEEQYGTVENYFTSMLSSVEGNVPAILFIDHINSIGPHREKCGEEIISSLIALFDGMKEKNIILIAATNRLSDIDPALRRVGRFDREICIGFPDIDDRIDILRKLTKRLNLGRNVKIEQLAKETHGLVGSDLASLCVNAAMKNRIKRKRHLNESMDTDTINSLKLSMEDFRSILSTFLPYLQENTIESANISWEDVGGLQDVKNNLQDLTEFTIKFRERSLKQGLTFTRGILLYGPSGCGKTLLAKAIASECGANFIYINGRELLTKSTGDSEIKLTDIFNKVRRINPCILFIDELDYIASKRSDSRRDDFKICDSMINELLIQLDSINPHKNIFIIGATNRPHAIDNAILRPGRINEIMYIPLPDKQSRKCIFEINLKNSPLADDVDLDFLAEKSEGFSGADLAQLCKIALLLAMEETKTEISENSQDINFKIQMHHFMKTLNESRPSVRKDEIVKYSNFLEKNVSN